MKTSLTYEPLDHIRSLTGRLVQREPHGVFPQRFVCLGVDLIDDSTEDDDSLYRDPNKRPPPSVPAARLFPSVPLSSKPQPTRSKSIQTDLSTQSKEDSYVIGTKIEHTSLDWGGGFPGSHDFYRTRDQSDQEIFILKPNVSAGKSRNKRKYSGAEDRVMARKSCQGSSG
ncbi:hypothetical protein AA0119_g9408 [Alternaria tenuissima]|uniref:Uncharacterized protein n=1 Tax=Alternaria tenuissima TaxID=119927 RepID=A0AB37W941_9PLEO|nr:hypothetical protein AA0115_g9722 [Alternaria tenuissima]RYN94184.1 hypothetical protein AA0119_g9408 [Alternaria tenuissima]